MARRQQRAAKWSARRDDVLACRKRKLYGLCRVFFFDGGGCDLGKRKLLGCSAGVDVGMVRFLRSVVEFCSGRVWLLW